MSPRRKFTPGEQTLLVEQPVPPRRWVLPLITAGAAVVMVAAITVSTLMLIAHQGRERAASRDRQVLDYVSWFMTGFTSIDPFHANDYVSRVLAQATGDFAQHYQEQENAILLQVARAEPATGTVLDAGVERWNDDGSVNVLVATQVTSKSPDEKQVFTNTNRWTATATQEGNQWKISNLLQVI
ncbi:mammalian cell entry protein [Mycobacterium sp. 1423905.2]|uniref:mammalian cell entry protein n=1 Tax=Mycobacterium sp. 1423905.2 TaxID=1856859 RepID=UPI000801F63A|nr:mammalian cell entry protein [Mycobacterium sp. 1423905.2]OBJ57364.1 mammalian cell entry protein [Mycobacterium sp. 1423905.2]